MVRFVLKTNWVLTMLRIRADYARLTVSVMPEGLSSGFVRHARSAWGHGRSSRIVVDHDGHVFTKYRITSTARSFESPLTLRPFLDPLDYSWVFYASDVITTEDAMRP